MDQDAIREIFCEIGEIRLRKMFGGLGIYRGELMFALEAGGEIYLKVDAEVLPIFQDLGSRPFLYSGPNGKPTAMSYWQLPESALDDPEEAARLGHLAIGAALRARAKKPGAKPAARR
jgi:DNA transformation protein